MRLHASSKRSDLGQRAAPCQGCEKKEVPLGMPAVMRALLLYSPYHDMNVPPPSKLAWRRSQDLAWESDASSIYRKTVWAESKTRRGLAMPVSKS